MTTPTVYQRTTVETEATVDGLLDAVAKMTQVAPPHAAIVDISNYYGCPDEVLEADELGLEIPEHEPTEYLAFVIEWDQKGQS